MQSTRSRARVARRALGVVGGVAFVAAAGGATFTLDATPGPVPSAARVAATHPDAGHRASRINLDSLTGRSGKLRARFVTRERVPDYPLFAKLFGDSAAQRPGIYSLPDSIVQPPFAFITLRPFSDKVRGRIGAYRMGDWPHERRPQRSARYANPSGFVEVTPTNQDLYVSEHFQLRDFLTRDQQTVWPKYLVLDERLIDKLELIIDELNRQGVPAGHLAVLSGFRTPQYNRSGLRRGGRARTSRHLYGDAADVFVDNDHDGWMDDLNGDGQVNRRDVQVLLEAVERIEKAHPDLIGGFGIYRATTRRGPFAHVDARGERARWGKV